MKTTRNSLLMSAMSLVLSVAILMGATFAWFTDSVTNSGNTIQAGKLEVGFQYKSLLAEDAAYADVPTAADQMGQLFANQRWEPGYSNGLDLKVSNNGTLALKWQLYFTNVQSTGGQNGVKLADVLDVYVIDVDDTAAALTDANKLGTLSGLADGFVESGALNTDSDADEFSVVLKMHEDAGNDYQNATVTFDVELRATQAPYEADGFHSTQYDAAANGVPDHEDDWSAAGGSASASKPGTGWAAITTLSVSGASVDVPADAIAADADKIELSVVPTTKPDGVTVTSTQTSVAYDISVTGLKDGNTEAIPVKLYVGTGLENVVVYHDTTVVTGASYDSATGYVSFTTTSFSPFTVVYDIPAVKTAEDFLAALQRGGAVILGSDISITGGNVKVPEGVTASIDLGGYTLSVNTNSALLNYGTITSLTNGSIVGGNYYGIVNYGTIGELNVNIKANGSSSMAAIYNYGLIEKISGGTYLGHSDSDYSSSITGSVGLYNTGEGVVELISGGRFQGSSVAFRDYNSAPGIKSVTGGTFDCPYMDSTGKTFCDSTTIDEVFYNSAPASVTGGTWYNVGTKINSKIPDGYELVQDGKCEMTSGKRFDETRHWVGDPNGTVYYYYTVQAKAN